MLVLSDVVGCNMSVIDLQLVPLTADEIVVSVLVTVEATRQQCYVFSLIMRKSSRDPATKLSRFLRLRKFHL